MNFDTFQQKLDDLDAKIADHVRRAEEASFWSPEHTVAPPFQEREVSVPEPKPAPVVPQAVEATEVIDEPVAYEPPPKAISQPSSSLPTQRPIDLTPTTPTQRPVPVTQTDEIQKELDALDQEIQSRINVSGRYRLAFGFGRSRTFSINDSNPDLNDRDFHYVFGERLMNTYDPRIYSQYELDIFTDLNERTNVFGQIVVDPWSYVGITSEEQIADVAGTDVLRVQSKYWGPNNSTIPQTLRTPQRDLVALDVAEAKNGHVQPFTDRGFKFADGFQRRFNIPAQDIDYEFRPLRKFWVDYDMDDWHLRIFPLADQEQVMTTDDPLGLSNTKDYWQHSPWLDQWTPIEIMNDATRGRTIRRGFYQRDEAFYAKDSQGRYLTLLRGAALEADFGRTYIGGMVASRYGLWDEYQEFDNVPGVLRVKHQLTPQWMIGGVYTFRVGMIDREPDSYNQVFSMDTKYYLNPDDYAYAQGAVSRHNIDRLSSFESSHEGTAWRGGVVLNRVHPQLGISKITGDFAWMGTRFQETLSRYPELRDDDFWGQQITFAEIPHDVRPFKIGTGLDRGRYVGRLTIETSAPQSGIENLFDVRHVRDTDTDSFIENVLRNELDYRLTPTLLSKFFIRWQQLPKTQTDIEPFIGTTVYTYSDEPIIGFNDPILEELNQLQLENSLIEEGLDPSRQTFGVGLEYEPNKHWTFQGSYTRTNDIPDFPRGLLNDVFLNSPIADPNEPNILLDRVQPFLYSQYVFGLPPYNYFSIVKERFIYQPYEDMQFIFHAAQNSYSLWGPIDENVNHEGISFDWQINDDWSIFADVTRSTVADLPRLVNTIDETNPELNFDDHLNFYMILKHQLHQNAVLNFEYGVFGKSIYQGSEAVPTNPYTVTTLNLLTVDTEHLFRFSLDGEF